MEIDSGSDEEIDAKFEDLKDWIRDFNDGKYDYKLPVGDKQQNSNAAARLILEQMGYEFKLPSYVNDNGEEVEIKAPGYDSEIGNTSFDRRVKDFSKKYELNRQKLIDAYKQKVNDLKGSASKQNYLGNLYVASRLRSSCILYTLRSSPSMRLQIPEK